MTPSQGWWTQMDHTISMEMSSAMATTSNNLLKYLMKNHTCSESLSPSHLQRVVVSLVSSVELIIACHAMSNPPPRPLGDPLRPLPLSISTTSPIQHFEASYKSDHRLRLLHCISKMMEFDPSLFIFLIHQLVYGLGPLPPLITQTNVRTLLCYRLPMYITISGTVVARRKLVSCFVCPQQI